MDKEEKKISNFVFALATLREYDIELYPSEVDFVIELQKNENNYIGVFIDKMREKLNGLKYNPELGGFPEEQPGTAIAEYNNLFSQDCLSMIYNTRRSIKSTLNLLKQEDEDSREMFPAWRLYQTNNPKNGKPGMEWIKRWNIAAKYVNREGVAVIDFVALKDSPIWKALGDGAGGYDDTIGNPYPPFTLNSGVMWQEVDSDDCESLGLTIPEAKIIEGDDEFRELAKKFGKDYMEELYRELKKGNI